MKATGYSMLKHESSNQILSVDSLNFPCASFGRASLSETIARIGSASFGILLTGVTSRDKDC
jgi:hypothetical protein